MCNSSGYPSTRPGALAMPVGVVCVDKQEAIDRIVPSLTLVGNTIETISRHRSLYDQMLSGLDDPEHRHAFWFQHAYYCFAALRRLLDRDRRSGSIWRIVQAANDWPKSVFSPRDPKVDFDRLEGLRKTIGRFAERSSYTLT